MKPKMTLSVNKQFHKKKKKATLKIDLEGTIQTMKTLRLPVVQSVQDNRCLHLTGNHEKQQWFPPPTDLS